MMRATIVAAVLSMAAMAAAGDAAVRLYVAPNGNDAWSGSLAEANAAGNDGPLATFTGARDRLRALRTEGKLGGPAHVQFREGVYNVTEAIVLEPQDSGTADAPVFYEAYPGEHPSIRGGRAITGWKQEGAFWTADVPEAREGRWPFGALWVNGERRVPARTPNAHSPAGDEPAESELFYMDGPVMEQDASKGVEVKSTTKFHYREGDLKAWDSLKDAIIVAFFSWETSLVRPKRIDEASRLVETTGPAAWPFCMWNHDQRYYVERLFEALDQPGEWYLNQATGKVYYIPLPGEDMAKAECVAPVAKPLLLLQGKPAEGTFVEHIQFSGLRMEFTDYVIEPQGHCDSQAASSVPAAFEATGARHCAIDRCAIGHVGTYGVWFRSGCQDNALTRSEIFDLGAGAVRIGEAGSPATPDEAACRNTIDNNFLHDGGRIFRGAVGVWIGRSSYNTLSHNEICDFRYTGISVGWSWGYDPSSANHNIIEYNHVHHVGHGQLSDMGAIYTLGISPGTVIRFNSFHDVMSNPRVSGGWGIYFDEGSTDILAENNIVYNTLTGTLHQHYGENNRVQNNIFAFSHGPQLVRSREEDHRSFYFERNIVYFNNTETLGSTWSNGRFDLDYNCYWSTCGSPIEFKGKSFEEWQAEGHDAHSIVADPLFVNAEAADFRLKPESPALKLGFVPIDPSAAGLQGEPEWVEKPKQIQREPFAPPQPPKPTSIADDFETTPVGAQITTAITLEEGPATIRVTDETAASGARSLKFTDAPGLQHRFNPHLVYPPHFINGRAMASFALRLEPGAVFYHEWRDGHTPYRVGPSVWVDAEGVLSIRGKELMTLPHSQWVTFAIETLLGRSANGEFSMTVTVPGQAPRQFDHLACGSKQFQAIEWFGFVSNTDGPSVFYLDDVHLETK